MVETYLIISCVYGVFVTLLCAMLLFMSIKYEAGYIDAMTCADSVKPD
ncbi:hypothetical protein KTAU_08910 [Thermogemmatispora aurantia]|uniref:Uncharacterized protein n=1 Tax=Thermogemmatispora aurantia TaxID=2045279 RepID=A0A5J4K433_9CHLR|nr:hypothetical protein KTAU_08910 [Thermogemmatispora aurantia]